MAEGRWLDDAYGGQPRPGNAGPHLIRWMKWTWPLMFVAAAVASIWLGQYGWVAGLTLWLASCAVANYRDEHAP